MVVAVVVVVLGRREGEVEGGGAEEVITEGEGRGERGEAEEAKDEEAIGSPDSVPEEEKEEEAEKEEGEFKSSVWASRFLQ